MNMSPNKKIIFQAVMLFISIISLGILYFTYVSKSAYYTDQETILRWMEGQNKISFEASRHQHIQNNKLYKEIELYVFAMGALSVSGFYLFCKLVFRLKNIMNNRKASSNKIKNDERIASHIHVLGGRKKKPRQKKK